MIHGVAKYKMIGRRRAVYCVCTKRYAAKLMSVAREKLDGHMAEQEVESCPS